MNINDSLKSFETYIGIIKDREPVVVVSESSYKNEYLCLVENEIYNEICIPFDFLTPSELEGMSEKDENIIRFFCNTLIQESGIVLKLPQTTILTAMNIFNRFFWKKSFLSFEPFHVICASISLSTKTEETFRRLRDIISSCYFILKRKEDSKSRYDDSNLNYMGKYIIDITSDLYTQIKANVVTIESYVLKELGFSLYSVTDHPHKYLTQFIKNLKGTRDFLQRSWNYLNDAYRTSLAVNFSSNVLACAAIFLAARNYYFALPNSVPWWEAYETKIEDIQEVCAVMMKVNEMEKIELGGIRKIMRSYSPYKEEIEELEKKDKIERDKEKLRGDKKDKKGRKEKYRYGRKSRSRSRNKKHKKHRKRSYSYSSSSRSSSYSKSYSSRR